MDTRFLGNTIDVKGGKDWDWSRPCLALGGAYGVSINDKGGDYWTFGGVWVVL